MHAKTKFANTASEKDAREVLLCRFWRRLCEEGFAEIELSRHTEAVSFILFFLGIHGYRINLHWNSVKNCYGEVHRIIEACSREDNQGIFQMGLETSPVRKFSINARMITHTRIRELTAEENNILLDACDLAILAYRNDCDLTGAVAATGRPVAT